MMEIAPGISQRLLFSSTAEGWRPEQIEKWKFTGWTRIPIGSCYS